MIESKIPSSLSSIGIFIIGFVLLMLVTIGWLFSYPDILMASVKIYTDPAPIEIYPSVSTTIEELYVVNKDTVKANQPIILLHSTTQKKDIDTLNKFFEYIQNQTHGPSNYLTVSFPNNLELGELQNNYNSLDQKYKEFLHYLRQSHVFVRIKALKREIEVIELLNTSLSTQEELYLQENRLTRKDLDRSRALNIEGVVSDVEKEEKEIAFLQKERSLETFKSNKVNNLVKIEQLKMEIDELSSSRRLLISEKIFAIERLSDQLKAEIKIWEDRYILRSPITGILSYQNTWNRRQPISANSLAFTVLPFGGTGQKMAQYLVPIRNSGKVEIGSSVRIEFSAFPSNEFGLLDAKINDISLVPIINNKTAIISAYSILPDSLISSYGIVIPFSQNMTGEARIITESKNLFSRLTNKFYDNTKNR